MVKDRETIFYSNDSLNNNLEREFKNNMILGDALRGEVLVCWA